MITSIGYDGSINEQQWAELARFLGAQYSVGTDWDWRVSAVAGQDRTIRINSGTGYGHGVLDVSDAETTLQLPTIATGSRWDLIVARRDWQAPGGTTAFTFVQGSAAKQIPAARRNVPGVSDDQPLALVQVTAGQTMPTGVVDLRVWHGDGGLAARDALVRTYMTQPGTVISLNEETWRRHFDDEGWLVWTSDSKKHTHPATDVTISQGGNLQTWVSFLETRRPRSGTVAQTMRAGQTWQSGNIPYGHTFLSVPRVVISPYVDVAGRICTATAVAKTTSTFQIRFTADAGMTGAPTFDWIATL